MAISWTTVRSLLLLFGPWLLPRAVGHYRRLQAEVRRRERARAQNPHPGPAPAVRPLPARARVVLALLAAAAAAWLLSAGLVPRALADRLPLLALLPAALRAPPPNVFAATQTRLQAPTDVLFARLAARRPLTPADEALRARLGSLDARLLYLQFGPAVLTACPFCDDAGAGAAAASAYLWYALVDLLAAHVANLVLVAVATSPLVLLGRRGSSSSRDRRDRRAGPSSDHAYDVAAGLVRRWRTQASVAAAALAALDAYRVAAYDRRANARATRPADLDAFYWAARAHRGLACGALLGGLALVLAWAVQGRHDQLGLLGVVLFGSPPAASSSAAAASTPAARVAAVTRELAATKSRLSADAIVRNTALRDGDLRARTQAYWQREVALVAAAMEERAVLEGVVDALEHRINLAQIERDADLYAHTVVPAAPPEPEPAPEPAPEAGGPAGA